jgi:hypothetical protein
MNSKPGRFAGSARVEGQRLRRFRGRRHEGGAS